MKCTNHTPISANTSPEMLASKASQLAALLTLFTGDCGAAFRGLDHGIQDAALWLAADLGREVMQLSEQLAQAALQKGGEA
jgi:hypothetical protein